MNTPLHFTVSVLFSEKDFKFYIGFTTNLEQRIQDHNNGGTKSTIGRRPLRLVFSESYLVKSDALRREKYLKTTQGKNALQLMLRDTKDEIGYQSN